MPAISIVFHQHPPRLDSDPILLLGSNFTTAASPRPPPITLRFRWAETAPYHFVISLGISHYSDSSQTPGRWVVIRACFYIALTFKCVQRYRYRQDGGWLHHRGEHGCDYHGRFSFRWKRYTRHFTKVGRCHCMDSIYCNSYVLLTNRIWAIASIRYGLLLYSSCGCNNWFLNSSVFLHRKQKQFVQWF